MVYEYKDNAKCPRCGRLYSGYPALSRRDDKTEICPDCGTEEAFEDYLGGPKRRWAND